MALTTTTQGTEISTEKYVIKATTDNAPTVTSVTADIFINTPNIAFPTISIEHLPDFGTNDEFSFEINSIVKDYFASEFLPLTGVNQTAIENALVVVVFEEQGVGGGGGTAFENVIIKNITQDVFEIEDFDLNDYDCGDAGSSSSKLLTSCPSILPIGDLTSIHVSCLTTSYDGGLNPKQEWTIDTYLNGVAVGQTTDSVDVLARGIVGSLPNGKYDISTYRFDFDHSQGYDEVRIYVRDIAVPQTRRSEIKTYKLNDSCEKEITLSWLNEFGTQDTFTFLGNIERSGKYTDETYKRVRPVAPLSTDVGDLVYKSSYNYQYDLFSDRMPEAQVQWLSKILINKRAAIQSKRVSQTVSQAKALGLLYNWYVIDQGGSGDGTANGGIVNQSQTGWAMPSNSIISGDYAVLLIFLATAQGGKMKETGFTNWDSPNTGATNSSKFTALGSGRRTSGAFQDLKTDAELMTYGLSGSNYRTVLLSNVNDSLFNGSAVKEKGTSIRLVRAAVGGENDGDVIQGAFIGNNGEIYDGVVIGTQVWLSRNLYETKLNDGSDIPNVTDNTDWENLTTGALCVYNNEPLLSTVTPKDGKYFPIVIETEETILEDKFTPETIFRIKFRMANRRKGLK